MAPRPLVAGNWKMNGTRKDGVALAQGVAKRAENAADLRCDLLVIPPFTLLAEVASTLKESKVAVGAQDCHVAPEGAYTGDVSAGMVADAGATVVLVGHSERRSGHDETNVQVKAKAAAAQAAGLVALICVGESLAERDADAAVAVVERQVRESLPDDASPDNTLLAYEPIWAIGTGRVASAKDVAEIHGAIRAYLDKRLEDGAAMRILYGGSVKPENAGELMAVDNVDGVLVGGASLQAEDFWAIAQAAP